MNLTDLIIIYLACGSPFGVYQFTKSEQKWSFSGSAFVFASFLLWPAFAIAEIARRIFPGVDADRNHRIEQIRFEIESLAFSHGTTTSLFEFREAFYRFTGLFEAANAKQEARPKHELFEISGHKNKALAARCLARRNREKLTFHQTQARNEFIDLMSQLAVISLHRDEIFRAAVELADHLGDADAKSDLAVLMPERTVPACEQTHALGTAAVKSSTHSATIAN